jgi:predicted HNH restriction endonuclease
MKMMNFRRFDPQFTADGHVGLTRGNKDEAIVWSEFFHAPEKLKAVVAAIRVTLDQSGNDEVGAPDDEEGIEEAAEGTLLTRLHRTRERSRKLVDQRKKSALKTHGRLFCEACDFDFSQSYGTDAGHIIDCHHTKPVHTLTEGAKTRLEDLALLCANCHRVVHSFRPWLTIEQLRERLAASRKYEHCNS